jgi:hypothetical protein
VHRLGAVRTYVVDEFVDEIMHNKGINHATCVVSDALLIFQFLGIARTCWKAGNDIVGRS